MNKESFIQVLRNPKSISADQLAQVEEVVEQFPYFQIARSIIACGSKSLNKSDAQAKLAKAAIYTTNRQLLKKYVNGQFDFEVADSIQIGIHRETLKKSSSPKSEQKETKRAKFRIIERRSKSDEELGSSGKFRDLTKKIEDDGLEEELTIISSDGTEETTVTHGSKEREEGVSSAKPEPVTEEATAKAEEPAVEETAQEVQQDLPDQKQDLDKVIAEIKEEEVEHRKEVLEKQEDPILTAGELVDDVFKNLEAYKKSRDHYLEVEQEIEHKQESDAIDDAILKASSKIKAKDEKSKAKEETVEDEPKTPVPEDTADQTEAPVSAPTPKKADPEVKETRAQVDQEPKTEVGAKESTEEEASETVTEEKTVKKPSISDLVKPSLSKVIRKSESEEKTEPSEKKVTPESSDDTQKAKPTKTAEVEAPSEKVDNNIISGSKKEDSDTEDDLPKDKKSAQKEIIERFIKTNPKILPADEEPKGEIADLSSSSGEMKDDVATENLAVILARQGKRDKAIEIYEKLILKIPKKKSYFAARIAELK